MCKKKRFEAGRIVNTHGINGEVKLEVWADSPMSLINVKHFYFNDLCMEVSQMRAHKDMLLIMFKGIENVTEAQRLKGRILSVDREAVILEEGRYFIQDLIGLNVIDEERGFNGKLIDVLRKPAQDVYVVLENGIEHYIPVVDEFIKNIDLEGGFIRAALIEGM